MNKSQLSKLMAYLLSITILASGCGKKSECEIPTRHVHKYTKGFSDGTTITKYLDSEYLNHFGYNWNEDYIVINKVDEKMYDKLSNLFLGTDNWEYLYNVMAKQEDYLMFYYEYTTIETYTTTDSDGNTTYHTRTVHHDGWHSNPYDSDNTGKTRLYHHRFFGYRLVYINGNPKLEESPAVDDIREIINDYQYFPEDCVTEVYETFKFNRLELPYLTPSDFDTFNGPDLSNKSIELENNKVKSLK